MKILHVVTGLNQGGAERQLANMVRSMTAKAKVFSILKPGFMAAEIEAAKVPVHSGYARGVMDVRWLLALKRTVRDYQPDVVMGWMYHGNLAASSTCWLGHGGPIIWNVRHSVHDLALEKRTTRWAIRACGMLSRHPARIVYNSRTAAQQHDRLGYSAHGCVVLPNGFDLKRFKPDPKARTQFRAEIGVSDDEVLIGVIGRSHPMKNHEGWAAAFKKLLDRGYPVRGVMIGTGIDRTGSPFDRAIFEAGIGSKIVRLGSMSHPELAYPGLDLLVMPSRWGEGFPNVVGEAMGCGVPAVVTPVGDAADVVADTGFVCDSSESDDIATGVEKALRCGRERLRALGQRARRRMRENYSLEAVALSYNQLLTGTVRGNGG